MKTLRLTIFYLFLTLVYFAYAEGSSCIKCHTDEYVLKKLVNLPHLGNSEGEG